MKISKRKLNVSVFGGAFDPIHNGHVTVAKIIAKSRLEFDIVWVMPCYDHSYGKHMVSPEHRLEMCRLGIGGHRKIVISNFEIKHKLNGETYCLVEKLHEEFPQDEYEFNFVIGMDNLLTFDKWKNYEELKRTCRFIVVPRPGYQLDSEKFLDFSHISFLRSDITIPEISSTLVRKNFEKFWKNQGNYDVLRDQLPIEVFNYILDNSLYK